MTTTPAAPAYDIEHTDDLLRTMQVIGDAIHKTSDLYTDLAGRWGRPMHRRLMKQGLNDEDAARLCRMMRKELNDLARSVIEAGQQMHAVADATSLVHDEVNRAHRVSGEPGIKSLNMRGA